MYEALRGLGAAALESILQRSLIKGHRVRNAIVFMTFIS